NAALRTLEYIDEAAIIGHGTGFVRRLERKPHNVYLQQWLNNGLFGLVAYLGILISALVLFVIRRYPPGIVFISVSLVAGVFSHTIIDQKPFLILLGMMLSISSIKTPSVNAPLYRNA
ncbi:MAG: hypothetical protein KDD62_05095, partial [Bdellovibrionales bacterium]|nr:hypothetical protein [Bdellovibrionales bacterium]